MSSGKYFTLKTEAHTRNFGKPEEPPKPMAADLERAAKLCRQGDYDGSLKENQRVLSLSGKNPPGDRALFNMALICAHSGNPKKDYEKALLFLKRIIRDYPQSSLVEEARIWARVLQENERSRQESARLRQVIEKSKDVDLMVDEKKRERRDNKICPEPF